MQHTASRLSLLRSEMRNRGTDALIITGTDPHMSENVPDHWRTIEWISGFTGSAGSLLITGSSAILWTDSRYSIQAARQLEGTGIVPIVPAVPGDNLSSWFIRNMGEGSVIGVDGRTISHMRFTKLREACAAKAFFFDTGCDPVSGIWTDRPSLPPDAAFDFPVAYAGPDREHKISRVREEMSKRGADYHFLAAVNDIMWLLNIRGKDTRYCPVLMSFVLISHDQVLLFADEEKIPFRIAADFDRKGIVILPYDEVEAVISSIDEEAVMLMSSSSVSESIYRAVPGNVTIIEDINIPAVLKAVRNSTEAGNMVKAMIRDGIALTRFFFRVEHSAGKLTELGLAKMLEELREAQEGFVSLSFATIMALDEHAALPHYNATEETDSVLSGPCILLVDSGSHYFEGTTDITRTVAIGSPSTNQKKDFTLVLKAMIGLSSAIFAEGTTGVQLDMLARKFLWEQGLDYGHGTGHGVGHCLNVHEGPQRISPSARADETNRILPGMVVSDEPAIYREGKYGIRTENLLICCEHEENEFGRFFRFSTLSLCYIDTSLTDTSLLSTSEIQWLNDYHDEVFRKLSPWLSGEEREWLRMKTAPVQ